MVRAAPQRRCQSQCRRADAARRAVHEHGLALGQPAAGAQRVVHGQVVEQQPRTGLEGHDVGQLEHSVRVAAQRLRPLPPLSIVRPVTRSPFANPLPDGALRTTPAISAPGTNGSSRLVLVEPARLQRVGERHPRRMDLDDHRVLVGGLVQLDERRRRGTVEAGYLNCAHRLNLTTSGDGGSGCLKVLFASYAERSAVHTRTSGGSPRPIHCRRPVR